MNASRLTLAASVAAAFFVAGCASDVPLNSTPAPVVNRNTGTPPPGADAGAGSSGVAKVDLTKDDLVANPAARIVYFDYDSFVVKDEYRPVIEAQAKVLNADRKKKISVEGHTDERGGSEYNLALGQKRAESVVKTLTLQGVQAAQAEAVSFGKERPAVQGSDEAAWAKNRRAELINR